MSGPVEATLGTLGIIILAVTLVLVPLPRQKPPEIDQQAKQVEPPKVPTPQQVVAVSQQVPQPIEQTEEAERLESIEAKLLHIQQQVQQMELKAERLK